MFEIIATVRQEQGTSASRRLRAADKVPAIVYGGKEDAVSITLEHNPLMHMQDKPEFYSEVLTLVIDGKETKVKIKDMQRHPWKPKILHLDFIRVS